MSWPRVSVCIPAYNSGQYIEEALESVRRQSYTDFEVLIIDDGSTDDTATRVSPFLKDDRFRYFHQGNGGVGKARNRALELAAGEWVAQLDADDVWMPEKLSEQLGIAEEDQSANLIYSDMIVFYSSGDRPERRYFEHIEMCEGDITDWLYEKNHLPTSSIIVKTDDLRRAGGFRDLRFCEDGDAWMRLAHQGILARACRKPLVRHRIHPGGLTQSTADALRTAIRLKTDLLHREECPRRARILRRSVRTLQASRALDDMKRAARNGGPDVNRYLWEWWLCQPSQIKRLIRAVQCSVSTATHLDMGRDAYIRTLAGSQRIDGSAGLDES